MNRGAFIISAGRSGSTLLSQLISLHSSIHVVQDFFGYRSNKKKIFSLGSCSGEELWTELEKPMSKELYEVLKAGHISTALNIHGAKQNVLLRTTLPLMNCFTAETLTQLEDYCTKLENDDVANHLSHLFEKLALWEGKAVWVERTGANLAYVKELFQLFPKAKYIFLSRNREDCVNSMQRHPTFLFRYCSKHYPSKVKRLCDFILGKVNAHELPIGLKEAMDSQLRDMESGATETMDEIPESQKLYVDYNDILNNTERTLKYCFQFLNPEVSVSDDWLTVAKSMIIQKN